MKFLILFSAFVIATMANPQFPGKTYNFKMFKYFRVSKNITRSIWLSKINAKALFIKL